MKFGWMRQAVAALRDRSGVSALEFALVAPILVVLTMGIVEVGTEILKTERLTSVAARLGDMITREEAITRGDLSRLLQAAPALAGDKSFGESSAVIVTAVTGDRNGRPRVSWQQRGDSQLPVESRIGTPNTLASLPGTVSLAQGETIVVVEVFAARAHGLIGGIMGVSDSAGCGDDLRGCIYKTSFYRGRLSDLAVIASR